MYVAKTAITLAATNAIMHSHKSNHTQRGNTTVTSAAVIAIMHTATTAITHAVTAIMHAVKCQS